MPISLTTGLPGHGKTLYTIEHVEKLRLASGRPVFYKRKDGAADYGIDELKLPWQPIPDVSKWYELPPGSIIVIDECQRLFVKRSQGAAVPLYVSKLETHRHDGHDLFLITQDAKNIDYHARSLVEEHRHVQRLYGTERFRLYTWQRAHDPTKKADLVLAQQSVLKFNSKFFQTYKSAEVHTVKRRLPWKWIAAVVVGLVVVPLLAFRVFAWFHGETVDMVSGKGSDSEMSAPGQAADRTLEHSAMTWTPEAFIPRVNSWPWSAPFYDDAAPEKNAPRIVGCFMLKIDRQVVCKCSNGQGDAQVTTRQCRDFLSGRHYDPARPYEDIKAANIAYLESDRGGVRGDPSPGGGETSDRGGQVTTAPSLIE